MFEVLNDILCFKSYILKWLVLWMQNLLYLRRSATCTIYEFFIVVKCLFLFYYWSHFASTLFSLMVISQHLWAGFLGESAGHGEGYFRERERGGHTRRIVGISVFVGMELFGRLFSLDLMRIQCFLRLVRSRIWG